MLVLPAMDGLETVFGPEPVGRLRLLADEILAAPFRAVGPRDPERLFNEIMIDSLAPLLLGIMRRDDRLRCVDLGCGLGLPMLPLALMMPQSSFCGIDSSTKRLSFGRRLVGKLNLDRVDFVEARLNLDEPVDRPMPKITDAAMILARAVAKPDRFLPFVQRRILGRGRRFLLYTTKQAMSEFSPVISRVRDSGAKITCHPYRRSVSVDQSPDYCILEIV